MSYQPDNQTWEFNFKLPEGELPQGMYKTKIIRAAPEQTKEGRWRVCFDFKVVTGDFMGGVVSTTLLLPISSGDKVLHYWRTLAVSVGFEKDQIRNRTQWRQDDFLSKNAYIFFRPPTEKSKYQFVRYISEFQFSSSKPTTSSAAPKPKSLEAPKQAPKPPSPPVSKPSNFGGLSKLKGLASK